MNTSTVVVHGATGTQGAPVVRQLLAAGSRVRAAVRATSARGLHPAAEPVVADLLDLDSLTAAYAGADAVVIQLPLVFAADTAVPQAETVLRALAKAGVRRAVFNTGGVRVTEPVGVPFVDARALLSAELAKIVEVATVVSPALTYLENLAAPWSAVRVRAGEIAYPLPSDLPVGWVALDDVGAAIADLISAPAPPSVQVFAGPQALTGEQVATELAGALGHEVRWNPIDPGEYERMLSPHVGPEIAAGIAAAYVPPAPGKPPAPDPDPATVVRGNTTLRSWAGQVDWTRT